MSNPPEHALSNPTVINAVGLLALYIVERAIPNAITNGVVIAKKKKRHKKFLQVRLLGLKRFKH